MLLILRSFGPDGVEPSSGSYKEPALTIELRAGGSRESVRPEGFEPPPCELKARCAAVTPRPCDWSRYAFQSKVVEHHQVSCQ